MNSFFAEFFGTAMILIFGAGVVANVVLNKTKEITAAG
jgi:glycerol uptake facilitator protein